MDNQPDALVTPPIAVAPLPLAVALTPNAEPCASNAFAPSPTAKSDCFFAEAALPMAIALFASVFAELPIATAFLPEDLDSTPMATELKLVVALIPIETP